jgi:hypothetical protein
MWPFSPQHSPYCAQTTTSKERQQFVIELTLAMTKSLASCLWLIGNQQGLGGILPNLAISSIP